MWQMEVFKREKNTVPVIPSGLVDRAADCSVFLLIVEELQEKGKPV